jgi:hypothetical protein
MLIFCSSLFALVAAVRMACLFVPTRILFAGTCTLASVNKDVVTSACAKLLAGSQCSLSCPVGFQSGGGADVTCPDAGGAVDASGFTCTYIPSMSHLTAQHMIQDVSIGVAGRL